MDRIGVVYAKKKKDMMDHTCSIYAQKQKQKNVVDSICVVYV